MSQIFAAPFYTAISAAGNVVSGAKLYFYATETIVLQTTYQDADLSTPHTNPVVADSAGRFPAIYLDNDKTYRVKLTESNDALIKDVDPINENATALRTSLGLRKSVIDYGADDTGAASSVAAFAAAATAGDVLVPAGTFLIDDNVTLAAPVEVLPEAQISVSTTKTLTFSRGFTAAETQHVFTGAGDVAFSPVYVAQAYPEWWGAIADGSTDSYAAIQSAVDAYPTGGGKIILRRPYRVSDTVLVTKGNTAIHAAVSGSRYVNVPHLTSSDTTKPCVKFLGTSAGGDYDGTLEHVELIGVNCTRSAMGVAGSHTIEVVNVLYCTIRDCGWTRSQYGLYAKNVAGLLLDGKNIFGPGGDIAAVELAGIYVDGTAQNSTGIMIEGKPLFYGEPNPTASVVFAYLDRATGGGTLGAGDRQIDGLQCSGPVHSLVYIQDGGGFSADVFIKNPMADNCIGDGIVIKSPTKAPHQQTDIIGAWISLVNASGQAIGVVLEGRKNAKIDATVINAGNTANKGVVLRGSQAKVSVTLDGVVNWAKAIETAMLSGSIDCSQTNIIGCVGNNTGPVDLTAWLGGVLTGNCMPFAVVTVAAGSNFNKGAGNNFSSFTDNGTGNTFT